MPGPKREQTQRPWEAAVVAISIVLCAVPALAILFASPAAYAGFVARERLDLNMLRAPGWPDPAFGGGVEGVWYTQPTIVDLHRKTFAYVLGFGPALPSSPTRGDFYSPEERTHLDGIREVLVAARVGVLVLTLAVLALSFRARRRGRLDALVRAGALAGAVVGGLLLGALIVAPAAAGQWLHQVVGLERPATVVVSNLAALYPTKFGNDVALRSALTFTAIALVIAAIAHISVVSAGGKTSAIRTPQPLRGVSD